MNIHIDDDFSLAKIIDSGQCFRADRLATNQYRFIYHEKVLYIRAINAQEYHVSCSREEWIDVWHDYFDLSTQYSSVRALISDDDLFLKKASSIGKGIRILKQDEWEMLITFIISQRKSIPAIKKSVELLARRFGSLISTEYGGCYSFPTVTQLQIATEEDLIQCKLGYRAKYVLDAIEQVSSGKVELNALHNLSDQEVILALSKIKGVGLKVANCVSLFAYHRLSQAPIDVWIKRIIDQEYSGHNPFPDYPDFAGVMQQYMFYYAQDSKRAKRQARAVLIQ